MNEMVKNLIIFLVPPEKFTSGGIISIFSLCKETRLVCSTDTTVVVATYPDTPSYEKNDLFENDEKILDFDDALKNSAKLESLIIHIPEYSVNTVYLGLDARRTMLSKIKRLHINILNQNIKLMANEGDVASLLTLTNNVTQTTAHLKYTTQQLADQYSIPTHLFSVRIDPAQYHHTPFIHKEDIVVVSPDEHPYRQKTIDKIRNETSFEVIELENLTYEEYKNVITRAKFTLTFGEGMDGYFIESAFSDSIGITVYNETFFPDVAYAELDNVYADAESLHNAIASDINKWGTEEATYTKLNHETVTLLLKIYGEKQFHRNVVAFYKSDYTITPSPNTRDSFLLKAVVQKDISRLAELKQIESQITEKNVMLKDIAILNEAVNKKSLEVAALKKIADERYDEITQLRESVSWRITSPIRGVVSLVKKLK